MEEQIAVIVDDLIPSSSPQCRICHEEGEEETKSMEVPCSCSGTLKFAHRECIQRWCDEKGNTSCEICLQKFEPGYTAPPKKIRLADVAVTIRGSLEVPRQNHSRGFTAIVATDVEILESDYAECSTASQRSTSCCRSIALIFAILLLARHLVSVLNGVVDHYAFTLLTLLVLRATGIIFPLYMMTRAVEAIQRRQQEQYQLHEDDVSSLEGGQEDEQVEYVIQMQR